MPGVSIYTICAVLSHSVVADPLQPHSLQPARLLCPWGFSRQEYWSGLPCPPPGDLPNPGIEPMSPVLPGRFFTTEPPGKPKNIGVGSLSPLQGILPTQESNQGLLHCRQIISQLSYQKTYWWFSVLVHGRGISLVTFHGPEIKAGGKGNRGHSLYSSVTRWAQDLKI